MDFEQLNENCIALYSFDVNYDYSGKSLKLAVKPAYGIKGNLEGKVFNIRLVNCIYVVMTNISNHNDKVTEFISWGRHKFNDCPKHSNTINCILDKKLVKKFIENKHSQHQTREMYHYFFENVFGDVIEAIGGEAFVD